MDGRKQVLGCFAAGILATLAGLSACAPPDSSTDPPRLFRVSFSEPGPAPSPRVLGLVLPTVAPATAPDSIERSRARYDEAGLALVDAQHVWNSLRNQPDTLPDVLQHAHENLRRARSALAEAARAYDEARRSPSAAQPLTQQSSRSILAQESERR